MAQKIFFQNLDKIRFFAAFAVFIGHGFLAWCGYLTPDNGKSVHPLIQNVMTNTGLGVEFFFLISGFLITYILLKEKEETGKIAIGKFFIRRALRIWPLYFVLIALAPFFIQWFGKNEPHYLENIFFIGNFDIIANQGAHFPFSHFWSIAVEEQFYVVWPFVIAFIPRKWLMPVFMVLIGLSMYSRYTYFAYDEAYYYHYYHTFCRMDTLIIGALIALYYDRFAPYFRLKTGWIWVVFLLFICLVTFTESNDWMILSKALVKKYLYIIPMILIMIHYITKKSTVKWGFFDKSLSYLGKASYGMYMIHIFAIEIVLHRFMINNGLREGWLFWVLYFVFCIMVVIISFEGLEKPFLRLKKYFSVVKTRKF